MRSSSNESRGRRTSSSMLSMNNHQPRHRRRPSRVSTAFSADPRDQEHSDESDSNAATSAKSPTSSRSPSSGTDSRSSRRGTSPVKIQCESRRYRRSERSRASAARQRAQSPVGAHKSDSDSTSRSATSSASADSVGSQHQVGDEWTSKGGKWGWRTPAPSRLSTAFSMSAIDLQPHESYFRRPVGFPTILPSANNNYHQETRSRSANSVLPLGKDSDRDTPDRNSRKLEEGELDGSGWDEKDSISS